jgi:hypothetical protein
VAKVEDASATGVGLLETNYEQLLTNGRRGKSCIMTVIGIPRPIFARLLREKALN